MSGLRITAVPILIGLIATICLAYAAEQDAGRQMEEWRRQHPGLESYGWSSPMQTFIANVGGLLGAGVIKCGLCR